MADAETKTKFTHVEIVSDPTFAPFFPDGGCAQIVHGHYGDGAVIEVFSFFPDEISFTADEFVGLTFDEARALHHQRDMEYLRS